MAGGRRTAVHGGNSFPRLGQGLTRRWSSDKPMDTVVVSQNVLIDQGSLCGGGGGGGGVCAVTCCLTSSRTMKPRWPLRRGWGREVLEWPYTIGGGGGGLPPSGPPPPSRQIGVIWLGYLWYTNFWVPDPPPPHHSNTSLGWGHQPAHLLRLHASPTTAAMPCHAIACRLWRGSLRALCPVCSARSLVAGGDCRTPPTSCRPSA